MQKWRGLVRFWGALAAAGAATPLVEGEPACGIQVCPGFLLEKCMLCVLRLLMVLPPSQYGKVCWKLWWPLLSEPQPSQSAETSKVIIRIITVWSLAGELLDDEILVWFKIRGFFTATFLVRKNEFPRSETTGVTVAQPEIDGYGAQPSHSDFPFMDSTWILFRK